MADDLGYGDVSAYKSGTIATPNIDRLAKEGLLFNNGYATAATCTPSRYSLITGEYPFRNTGAHILAGDAKMLIDVNKKSIAGVMKDAGYKTAVIGKWHLGLGNGIIDWNGDISPTPNTLGFDYSFIMAATNDRVPTVYVENHRVHNLKAGDSLFVNYKTNFKGEPTGLNNPELTTMKWHHGHNNSIVNGIPRIGYMKGGKSAIWDDTKMAQVFVDEVKSYIDKSKSAPFFLYYALHQPHVPRIPNNDFVGKSGMGPRGDAILEADWCVGQLLDYLDKNNLTKNTLIFFTSDNGPVLNDGYYDDAVEKLGNHTPAGPLRGGKYSLFDGGTHVPFIVTWPAQIKHGKSNAVVSQVDIMASLAALTNQSNPGFDSENHLAAFTGKDKTGRKLLVVAANTQALRQGDWLYIPASKGAALSKEVNIETGILDAPQLYNLRADPGQKHNIASKYAEKVSAMEKELKAILAKK